MLDGGAAGVERVDEFVAAEAGEAFSFSSLLLYLLAALVGGEEQLDGIDFLRGAEAGEIVRSGAGDEGGGALDEDGAAGVDAGADEVSVEGKIRGGIAVLGEHFEFLFGGALDFPESGFESFGGGEALGGLGDRLILREAGVGGAVLRFRDGGSEGIDIHGADALIRHFQRIAAGGGQDGGGFIDVLELFLVEVASVARGIRCGIWHWNWFFWHMFVCFSSSVRLLADRAAKGTDILPCLFWVRGGHSG